MLFYVGKSQENFDEMNQKPTDRNLSKHFGASETKSKQTKATRSSTTVDKDFFQEKEEKNIN